MSLEIETSCPLGHTCEKVVDGKIDRCAWYTKVEGKNPQSEEQISRWGCAMAWLPVLMVENAQTNRGQTQAIESFRNKVVEDNHLTQRLMVEGNPVLKQTLVEQKDARLPSQ